MDPSPRPRPRLTAHLFLNHNCQRSHMKAPLQEAATLFRENEMLFGDVKQDKERANLYRALALLAESLLRIEGRLDQLEAATMDPSEFPPG
ncbi:MAG: hypothetical protein JWR19_3801 [Pedosphaera sp.]|nr:hypothetical protein [Pedosphaera sp.]